VSLTDTASGHVLLAFRDQAEQASMLAAHVRMDGEQEIETAQLMRQIEDTRKRGHSRMESRQIRGVINLSYPVMGANNRMLAALNVPYIERIDKKVNPSLDEVQGIVQEISARLSRLMGFELRRLRLAPAAGSRRSALPAGRARRSPARRRAHRPAHPARAAGRHAFMGRGDEQRIERRAAEGHAGRLGGRHVDDAIDAAIGRKAHHPRPTPLGVPDWPSASTVEPSGPPGCCARSANSRWLVTAPLADRSRRP
jgi:hypothetical protein